MMYANAGSIRNSSNQYRSSGATNKQYRSSEIVSKQYRSKNTARNQVKAIHKGLSNERLILYILLSAIGVSLIFSIIFFAFKSQASNEQTYKYYTSVTVEAGDTLWDIADQYASKEYSSKAEYISEVINLNHLDSETIHSGEKLIVPYFSTDVKL